MKKFRDVKIGSKLLFGFSVMMFIVCIIGFAGFISARKIGQHLDEIYSVRLPSIDYILEVDRDLHQLLVAERSMIFSDIYAESYKQLLGEYEENLQQSHERWEQYKALISTPEEAALVPGYEKAREEWKTVSREVVELCNNPSPENIGKSNLMTLGEGKQKFDKMRDVLDQLTNINLRIAQEEHNSASLVYQSALSTIVIVAAAGLIFGVLLTWGIGRGVTRPLSIVIEKLTEASDQVASASGQISAASQSLAQGSSEQASSLEETSSSLEEMTSMTRQNADNAKETQQKMSEAAKIIDSANKSLEDMIRAITKITESSRETGKIIKTIDEIAFQTNLLALNAAVEAARAGEAGAGFAVVAGEVRNLAMRAAEAARNTSELIEGTIADVMRGNELTQKTQEAFQANHRIAMKVSELIDEITTASDEQAQGIGQVNTAVAEMDKVVQQNAANAEESASASEEMSAQALQMKSMIQELVFLVKGKTDEELAYTSQALPMTSQHEASRRRPLSSHSERENKSKPATIAHAKEVKPSQVIPLDDDDFTDF